MGKMASGDFCRKMADPLELSPEQFEREWTGLINVFFDDEKQYQFRCFLSQLEKNNEDLFVISGTNELHHKCVLANLESFEIYIPPQNWFLSYEQGISANLDGEFFRKSGKEAAHRLYADMGINIEEADHLDKGNDVIASSLLSSRLKP
jgi:hypothetical protein